MQDKAYIQEKLKAYKKALNTLSEALQETPSDIERDAAIQRFEYCFELSWKILKLVLKDQGSMPDISSPKAVFKKSYEIGLLGNEPIWTDILIQRNNTTHTYNEALAKEVYEKLSTFYEVMVKLLEKLTKDYLS